MWGVGEMRNPKLKYTGLIMAIIGGLMAASGLYFGSMPYYNTTIADYSIAIGIGVILLIAGLILWIFIFE